jgi:serine/threonine protein kinase
VPFLVRAKEQGQGDGRVVAPLLAAPVVCNPWPPATPVSPEGRVSIETPSSTPRARDPLIGQTIAGRFVVEELIGQGGMGKVYRAQHLGQGRPVVLKLLKPALLEDPTLVGRFEREAEAASRLDHPNLIAVLDFGRIGPEGTLYIAMELVPGKDLRALLRDEWPVQEPRLCNIVAQVLSALSAAHAGNVIHRDLKPENIMVEARDGGRARTWSAGPRSTWRPSRPPAAGWMRAAICTRWGSSSTRCAPGTCRSTGRTRWKC